MSVVIDKLPHPYKLTQQITKKWKRGFFFFFLVKGFLERERGERKKFQNFLEFFYFIFSSLFYQKFLYFSPKKKKEGVFIGGMKKIGAR